MEFRVLGPLEVRELGRAVALGAAKQRALLGVLLLHPNESISVERLVDELWGGGPPARSHKLVQGYVSGLRKLLGADLELGRQADLIGELEALVAAHPLQERVRGLLMLALYRSGRQADALELYRVTRSLLADELGLEPSTELQRLERLVLTHDAELDL